MVGPQYLDILFSVTNYPRLKKKLSIEQDRLRMSIIHIVLILNVTACDTEER
jgi:hypothetical protein